MLWVQPSISPHCNRPVYWRHCGCSYAVCGCCLCGLVCAREQSTVKMSIKTGNGWCKYWSTKGQPLIFVAAQEQEFDALIPSSNGLSKSLTGVVFKPTLAKMLSQKHQMCNHFTISPTTAIWPEQPQLVWASCIWTTDLAFLHFGLSIQTIDRVIQQKISQFIQTVDRVYPILSRVLARWSHLCTATTTAVESGSQSLSLPLIVPNKTEVLVEQWPGTLVHHYLQQSWPYHVNLFKKALVSIVTCKREGKGIVENWERSGGESSLRGVDGGICVSDALDLLTGMLQHSSHFSAVTVQECGVSKVWSDFQHGLFTPSILHTQLKGMNKTRTGNQGGWRALTIWNAYQ